MEEHKKNTFRKVCSFLKDIWFPVLILGLVVFACLFGELIATHSPTQGQLSEYRSRRPGVKAGAWSTCWEQTAWAGIFSADW